MRFLEPARRVAVRIGEASPHVTEHFSREKAVRHTGAVDRDEWRTPSAALLMDQLSDDLLADTAFTGDENLCVRSTCIIYFFLNELCSPARTDETNWVGHARSNLSNLATTIG